MKYSTKKQLTNNEFYPLNDVVWDYSPDAEILIPYIYNRDRTICKNILTGEIYSYEDLSARTNKQIIRNQRTHKMLVNYAKGIHVPLSFRRVRHARTIDLLCASPTEQYVIPSLERLAMVYINGRKPVTKKYVINIAKAIRAGIIKEYKNKQSSVRAEKAL